MQLALALCNGKKSLFEGRPWELEREHKCRYSYPPVASKSTDRSTLAVSGTGGLLACSTNRKSQQEQRPIGLPAGLKKSNLRVLPLPTSLQTVAATREIAGSSSVHNPNCTTPSMPCSCSLVAGLAVRYFWDNAFLQWGQGKEKRNPSNQDRLHDPGRFFRPRNFCDQRYPFKLNPHPKRSASGLGVLD